MQSIAFAPTGETIALSSWNNVCLVTQHGGYICEVHLGQRGYPAIESSLVFDPSGDILVASCDSQLFLVNADGVLGQI